MSMAIFFVVLGQPQGKGRPRATTRGGFVRLYTDAKTRSYEDLICYQARFAMNDQQPFATPVAVRIDAFYNIPVSWSKKKQQAALRGEIMAGKPDLDNIAKSVLDGLQMNKVCITDDQNVIKLTVEKRFSFQPRIEVCVYEVFQ